MEREQTDDDLVRGIIERDQQCFEALYERYSPIALAICVKVLQKRVDAEIVLSEIFWEIWQKADRYNPDRGTFRTYIVMLARSRAVDRLRAHRTLLHLEDGVARDGGAASKHGEASDPAQSLVDAEERQRVEQAIRDLPEGQQQSIRLAFYDGLTHVEVAERLKMPVGSVKTGIRQGLIKLRRILGVTACL